MSEPIVPEVMDLDEFRDAGWLMEANRQFFHPRGLALFVEVNEGRVTRLGVYRDDDPEGWRYGGLSESDLARAAVLGDAAERMAAVRLERFGWVVQPIAECGAVG